MCDDVNIIVQETNEIVNIVSSEIQEVIDINVFETTEEVTLNITEQLIQVNVNKITNTGSNQTLAETLIYGNQTGGTNILLNDTDSILLENGSYLKKGTYDFGANGGISLICGVGFENMWQGGIRHVFDNNGFIRHSTNCFNIIPDANFDITLRFKTGSIWTLDDLTNYICIEATEGDAKWELYKEIPSSADFVPYTGATQDVNINTNDLYTKKVFLFDEVAENYGSIHYADGDLHIEDADGHKLLVIEDGFMQLHLSDTIQSNLFTTNLTETRNHYLPNASGTIALTIDIPTPIIVDVIPTDGSSNAVSSNGVFDALANKQNSLGFTAENVSNKSTDVVIDRSSNTKYPTVKSVYDWATNAFTTQTWVNSQGFITNVITALGFTPENVANKSTNVITDQTSNTKYPSVKSVYDWAIATFRTSSQVASQITTALIGYATESYVNSQGFITNVITALGYTPENVANKSTTIDLASNTKYPTTKAVGDYALAKLFSPFSFKANNTSSSATAQDIYFQQSGKQTYTGTVTWTGVVSPSGTTNHSFNWIRIGNMVTLNITLVYQTPGNANTNAVITLLPSMPTPIIPDGLSGALRYIYPANGKMSLNETSITTAASEAAMRINATSDGYELVITQASANQKVLKITCQYFTA